MEYDKNRCYQTLDEKGGYFCRHTQALTREDLRGKHEIAAELGYRDSVIDIYKKALEKACVGLARIGVPVDDEIMKDFIPIYPSLSQSLIEHFLKKAGD